MLEEVCPQTGLLSDASAFAVGSCHQQILHQFIIVIIIIIILFVKDNTHSNCSNLQDVTGSTRLS